MNPKPAAELREMTTDRPDKTESPVTADAGHIQIETDLVNWSHDRSAGTTMDGIDFGATNFKVGLSRWLDVQAVVQTYHYERTRADGHTDTDDGFGDITLRTKINLWGNDGGRTAFAIMPFVTLPTARGDFGVTGTEGGVILPLAIEISEGWGLGLMTEVDFGDSTHWVNSITLGHDLTERLGMYVEFFSDVPMEDSPAWVGTVDVGFTYAVTANVRLDAGVNFGVTDAADDINPFVGFSVRF